MRSMTPQMFRRYSLQMMKAVLVQVVAVKDGSSMATLVERLDFPSGSICAVLICKWESLQAWGRVVKCPESPESDRVSIAHEPHAGHARQQRYELSASINFIRWKMRSRTGRQSWADNRYRASFLSNRLGCGQAVAFKGSMSANHPALSRLPARIEP